MFTSIEQFENEWQVVSDETRKIFSALTDESLGQSVADDHRTLGRMAWHIVQTIPDMAARVGLQVEGPAEDTPVPASADEIKQAYDNAARTLAQQINANWNDETLEVEDDMYGETWKRGATLYILIKHEIHHRGQMTVLMRQAGLKVPGIYGPSKEEWTQYGMPEPKI
ncbi:MAG: hypothetical protein GTO45_20245 [Candidatus Aminicenantes bacterium]|nr:hypothetical protein [Candidatus Aminicenantes bacterium]NIM81126.1 hypothetical protein [Candidatus Aminicenantes bacterium]NIN20500.1 hypothetical protein [Candidatus Aminicenantes bacterium]NIN44273.1 hypothetical protein [Candidatus Aminicenantes bacterium]NIN87092.1 hypothetical protein [Candidatus Aminicenantes bacterium]